MNRHYPAWVILLQGLALGFAAFAVAELSLLGRVADPTEHDMMLAQRLGLVYTPAMGAWLGWLQRDRKRVLVGALVGLGLGVAYVIVCLGRDFLAIMVGF